jgi:hypothetical protein
MDRYEKAVTIAFIDEKLEKEKKEAKKAKVKRFRRRL